MRALIFFLVIAFAGLLASLVHGQTNGDLILQFKGSSGASLQYVTPSTGTGIPAFNGASPNRIELLPRSTFSTPADVTAYAQPLSNNLTTLAGVTSGTTGRSLLGSSSATAAKTVLGIHATGGLVCRTLGVVGSPPGGLPGYFTFTDQSQAFVVRVGYNGEPTSSFDIELPTAGGTWLTSGSSLNADNISSGSLALARLAQGGATVGQALAWNGTTYAPTTVTAPVTSVAGRTGAVTLSTSDISGLGTIATQAADNVAITGGSIALTSTLSTSLNGAVSAPSISATGTWYSGGTATTTKPYVLIQPTGTASSAWSTGGTGLGINAAPGFSGKLWDFQVNGVSIFSYSGADGYIYVRGLPALIYGDGNTLNLGLNAAAVRQAGAERLWVVGGIGFAPVNNAPNANDTYLMRRAEGSLGLGIASATPAAQYLGGQDATGTNIAGGDFGGRGGNGTGTGGSGKYIIQTAPPGSTGSTANTMTNRVEVDNQGVLKLNNATTVPSSDPSGGGYLYSEGGALKWRGSSGTVTIIANP